MTRRFPVHGLDPAGGTPGQMPTINAAGTAVEYTTPAGSDAEFIRDTIAAALVAGTNVTITPDDAANTITISAAGGGGGGGGAWSLISGTTLTVASANVDFTSIPATYRDLVVEAKFRSTRASATDNVALKVGTGGVVDTGANYRASIIVDNSTARTLDTNSATATYFKVCENACPGATADADTWGTLRASLLDYADPTYWRTIESMSSAHILSASSTNSIFRNHLNGHWKNKTGAIDCLRLSALNGNFVVGSSFRLYGRS